jgi:hypothetical protein
MGDGVKQLKQSHSGKSKLRMVGFSPFLRVYVSR